MSPKNAIRGVIPINTLQGLDQVTLELWVEFARAYEHNQLGLTRLLNAFGHIRRGVLIEEYVREAMSVAGSNNEVLQAIEFAVEDGYKTQFNRYLGLLRETGESVYFGRAMNLVRTFGDAYDLSATLVIDTAIEGYTTLLRGMEQIIEGGNSRPSLMNAAKIVRFNLANLEQTTKGLSDYNLFVGTSQSDAA